MLETTFEDEGLEVHDNTAGIKMGSKWTVSYGKPIGTIPRKELTCLRDIPTHLIKKDTRREYSEDAAPYHNTVFPLLHGAPRDDRTMPLAQSVRHLYNFSDWLLRGKYDKELNVTFGEVPEESGIVFCLPMIKQKVRLEALKSTLKRLPKGKIGIEFIGEAWAAALGTLPIQRALSEQVLSVNTGSSTLEVDFFAGLERIQDAVWTFGGSDVDRRLASAIEMKTDLSATEDQARRIKESFSYSDNKDIPCELIRDGWLDDTVILDAEIVKEQTDWYIDEVTKRIIKFLALAKAKNEVAVTALQVEGRGYLTLVGGMTNMPGFAEALHKNLVEIGGISKRIQMLYPSDGVIAPAVGAWKLANYFESVRIEQGVSTWDEIEVE